MASDDDLFRREMADVTPIKPDNRVQERAPHRKDSIREQLRRAAAVDDRKDNNPLTVPELVPQIGPLDIVGLKKDGVQEGVYRKLRLGKYDAQDVLDLHRVRLLEARNQVQAFLENAHNNGMRTVLISHGKGLHSERPGFLKSYVMHWLEESRLVLAYHSTPANRGGSGATQVLVRKNSQARQNNREFFIEAGKQQR
ncbi:MAG: DNA mismatch repair protein MutS [Alcanivorax borkumensis]|uniref:Smr domain protein n=1 Tax=Alcanivorax borkumensis (strain ATCC 700651 / DSM 11573 / NCIMB 13689 / SK2) TaxID=393595 RepID=Q0VP81_ALCBS|nr:MULTISPECIES: DNA endonuclease SmrA [Alcanivorax]OJH08286.1 MAG: DNA mismatch repair protein MutS [Alcanivorax borkumensis]EUC70372.1 DNA mismatch repair protein MutS [Alcanivorax sp. 97CO-5]PKG02041.1 DNA endonuclease SmrA [Alcanivorax sp. 97CO-6]CAL17017.1 Smr domain protein [Alcanivorax borkumensis SK2]BAP14474.1 DNA mismatch repair protein MutS [Alcanivorax sp. NBRC 101098]